MGHILTLPEAVARRAEVRAAGRTFVLTNGVFDLLHVGHLDYLEKARALGDYLVVGVNGDGSARALKGEARPWAPAPERARLLAALAPVDGVVIFEELTAVALVRVLRPDVYAKGNDYAVRPLPEAEAVKDAGGRVALIEYRPGHSTTDLARRIALSISPAAVDHDRDAPA